MAVTAPVARASSSSSSSMSGGGGAGSSNNNSSSTSSSSSNANVAEDIPNINKKRGRPGIEWTALEKKIGKQL